MNEEEKQIHLYMHSKNELGLATLCVEKDKEIERLKEKNEELRALYESEREVKEDYKSKNNKAIEYIEENCTEYGEGKWAYRTINADNTLNILKGVDK